eukprot:1158310-Pelagomonas_calceolata.AAC.5
MRVVSRLPQAASHPGGAAASRVNERSMLAGPCRQGGGSKNGRCSGSTYITRGYGKLGYFGRHVPILKNLVYPGLPIGMDVYWLS